MNRLLRPFRAGRKRRPELVPFEGAVEPPRLLLRFGLYTAVGLAIAGACILLFVRQHGVAQAERSAQFHIRFVAAAIMSERLQASDFQRPVTGVRRAELDTLFQRQIGVGGTLRMTLYGRDGQVTYSNAHETIGTTPANPKVRTALTEPVTSEVATLDAGDQRKVFKAYVPITLPGGEVAGVLELDQDYAPIASSVNKAFLPVAGVLQAVFILLFLSLFPILRQVTRSLRRHAEEVEHQALHDALTGLPNRVLFRDRAEQAVRAAKRAQEGAAIMLVDLDRFKEVNDTLGHEAGDQLLQEFARRLNTVVRDTDTVARLGGDEFGLVLPGAKDAATALFVAERLRNETDQPFVVGGLSLAVEGSVGIALFPEHGHDVETLVRHADVAMYSSKRTHGPKVYESGEDGHAPARLALVGELRRAVEERELVVDFQPTIDLATGAVSGAEALVRWNHPEHGLLPPDDFVPLARQTGLIRLLTAHVLEVALAERAKWEKLGFDIRVAVNVSGRDLHDFAFPDEVDAALERAGVHATGLELEVPETSLPSDPARVASTLTRLGARGVVLAVDDFGSGYCSLSYLRQLPVNILKIDQSLITNLTSDEEDELIVRSTIELGQNLGLAVVAEGVETEEQRTCLTELGCTRAQGFGLKRPVGADEFRDWLLALPEGRVTRLEEGTVLPLAAG